MSCLISFCWLSNIYEFTVPHGTFQAETVGDLNHKASKPSVASTFFNL